MTHVFLEQTFDPPLGKEAVLEMASEWGRCLDLYRVDWQGSLLSKDGRYMLCHFESVDAESARTALRQSGAGSGGLWHGTVHEAPGSGEKQRPPANVMVTRRWDHPVSLESIQAIEDQGAWCLEAHGVTFLRTFFSADKKRMVCLYNAPDAESVRTAQQQAGMPVEKVRSVRKIHPQDPG